MKEDRFYLFMNAVDDELLEEAQMTMKKSRKGLYGIIAAAACVAVVMGVLLLPAGGGMTADALLEKGYEIPLPSGASGVSYALVETDAGEAAQASYRYGGSDYVCQVLRAEESYDAEALNWSSDGVNLSLSESDGATCVSWYELEQGLRWSLTTADQNADLLTTASGILELLGYDVAVAPEGAEDVTYRVFQLNELVVAETGFTCGGSRCAYHVATTYEIAEDFADISGASIAGESKAAEIGWCAARVTVDADGHGTVCWFDIAPGLLYSLEMESGATESGLLALAEQLYAPAQDDVG